MGFTVSVRDANRKWVKDVINRTFELPKDCYHNSVVLYELSRYIPLKLPEFGELPEDERKLIADVTAYLLRPDLIKGPASMDLVPFGPIPVTTGLLSEGSVDAIIDGEVPKPKVHFRNDPEDLYADDWRLPEEGYHSIGAELYRCLHGAVYYVTDYEGKLQRKEKRIIENPMGQMMVAADVLAYLLIPSDLTDYQYTENEIDAFHNKLEREMREV